MDSRPQSPCVVAATNKFTWATEALWRERDGMATLYMRERALTPAWTGFYCFSGHITSRMVLIYYAQILCRGLPFTDNKGKNVANYSKEKDVADARGKVFELVTLHTWEV